MPTLEITRSSEYANRLRKIKLFLDGKHLDSISNGETMRFEIAAGNHLLQAKVDWCTSNVINFSVAADATKSFTMTSFAKNNSFGIFAAIYYITLGANKYLQLEEKVI